MNRLFVPLNTRWHSLFKSGEKTWELRGIDDRFNESTVWFGREVELRRGYKYEPLYGKVDAYVLVAIWDDLPEHVKIGIVPNSVKNDPEVRKFVQEYCAKYEDNGLIAFKVILDDLHP
jgi:hypothetical protein